MPAWMDDDLNDRRPRGLYRVRRHLQSSQGPRVQRITRNLFERFLD